MMLKFEIFVEVNGLETHVTSELAQKCVDEILLSVLEERLPDDSPSGSLDASWKGRKLRYRLADALRKNGGNFAGQRLLVRYWTRQSLINRMK